MIYFGAVRCARLANLCKPASTLIVCHVDDWSKGYLDKRGVSRNRTCEIASVLEALPRAAIPEAHLPKICLSAIRVDDIAAAAWAIAAMGREVSRDGILDATGADATHLMGCALAYHSKPCAATHAVGTRAAAWLCDLLAYAPTAGDLRALVRACVRRTPVGYSQLPLDICRVGFMLSRWPHALWESRAGVDLVRGAFSSCINGSSMTHDVVDLIDAILVWCEAIGVTRLTMHRALSLGDAVLLRAKRQLGKDIAGAWHGAAWTRDCADVCYGTCARDGSCVPPAATAPHMPFCNGRARSDADAVAAWSMPSDMGDPCFL
ncbi:hypothetical protein pdul_cds_577 [Pandoravirus dulcis]|uniref:Uncharacterized protein n=1 Tax=Pandoravirus dulcis TaxID=1349409 RepID=S4VX85_9VIRU|nr:hypothetical protein pdul_cds_577 [Pandoravirus dulcis]AGO82696.1 hypothetical protein pdul_cds_577 [Pandoravirus dulcis]